MSSMPARDADASHPRSGTLTPTSQERLSCGHGACSASSGHEVKNKPEIAAMEYFLKPSIGIKPHPPKLHVLPYILLPLMLLPRQNLPLACLDLASSSHGPPLSRFYESHVKILELESRLGSEPSILIAKNEPSGTKYAVERKSDGLYAVCRLGSWVDLASLASKATALSHHRLRLTKLEPGEKKPMVVLETLQIQKENSQKRAAIEAIQSLVRKRARSQSVTRIDDAAKLGSTAETDTGRNQASVTVAKSEKKNEPLLSPIAPATAIIPSPGAHANNAEAIFDNIRTQYFNALYKSMGSLAYFAKGPLSRARSAFHLDLNSNLDMTQLIDFLRGLVLTTVQIDKKYRETLPSIISNMKNNAGSSDDEHRISRRRKKMKLGTDGLYPLEDQCVCQWWNVTRPELGEDQEFHSTAQIKSHVSLLRTRETQLQMIIILEIMALEKLGAATEAGENTLPLFPGAEPRMHEQPLTPLPQQKKRNKHNMPVLLDVHADRLTIWQSTASDEQLLLEDSQVPPGLTDGQIQQKASAEPLRDFCIDVIVPFFATRLPDLCDAVNRKLGGPTILHSPLKSRSSKHVGRREQKPGAAARRSTLVNDSRKTLQRALSTDQQHRRGVSRGPSNVIALMRSSASVTTIKREGSEPVPTRTLFKGESKASPWRQPLLSRSASASKTIDSKADKKAMVEAELKDAISALRKPNRDVIGRAMTEADERRAWTSLSAKKAKRASRNCLAASIQVRATPVNNRFKDALGARVEPSKDSALDCTQVPNSPSRIRHFASAKNTRAGYINVLTDSPSPAVELIGSTPVRPSGGTGTAGLQAVDLLALSPSSPLTAAHASRPAGCRLAAESASSACEWTSFPESWREQFAASPMKRGALSSDAEGSLRIDMKKPPSMSIYQKLGWDEDLDDLR